MTENSVQPNFGPDLLVCTESAARISVMPKKRGPYSTKPKAAPKTPQQLGHYLREWRAHKNMTIEDLATAAELSVGSVSNIETGKQKTSMDSLQRLAKALGIARGMLIEIDPTEEPQLWAAYIGATATQRGEIARVAAEIVKRKKLR